MYIFTLYIHMYMHTKYIKIPLYKYTRTLQGWASGKTVNKIQGLTFYILWYIYYTFTYMYTLNTYTIFGKIPPNDSTHIIGLNTGKVLQEMWGHTSYIMKYLSIHVHIHIHIYTTFEKIPPNENTHIVCLKSGKCCKRCGGIRHTLWNL